MLKTKGCPMWHSILLGALLCPLAFSQMTVTGTINGTVTDPTAKVIAGARVTATSTTTSEPRTAVANESGDFNLVALQPGTYNLRVEFPGFKGYEKRGVVVTANEHVALGNIMLQLGIQPLTQLA